MPKKLSRGQRKRKAKARLPLTRSQRRELRKQSKIAKRMEKVLLQKAPSTLSSALAEAELMGRLMAHAYREELMKISGTSSPKAKGHDAKTTP